MCNCTSENLEIPRGCDCTPEVWSFGPSRNDGALRITRCIRLAKDVNGIAGLQVAPGKNRIGVQREISDRDRADCIECPGCETLHPPGLDRPQRKSQPGRSDGSFGQSLRAVCRTGKLTSASFTPSSP